MLSSCRSKGAETISSEGQGSSRQENQERQALSPPAFSSRVTAIGVGEELIVLGHDNGGVSLWRKPLSVKSRPLRSWFAHASSIRRVSILKKGHLSSLSADGSLAHWRQEGDLLRRIRLLDGHPNDALTLADGVTLFGSDRGVLTAVGGGGERKWRTAGEHGRAVFGLSRLDQSRVISVGSDGWVRCWLVEDGERCGALPIHDGWATAIKSINDAWVTAGSDGYVKLWSKGLRGELLSAGNQAQRAQLASPVSSVKLHERDITSLALTETSVITGSEGGRVSSASILTDREAKRLIKREWSFQSDELKPVLSVALDNENGHVIVGGGPMAKLTLISLSQGRPQFTLNLEALATTP